MYIIGITGTIGAGKGTIVDYLVSKMSFLHYSVRGYLTEEIARRGMPLNRDSMVTVANDLREKNNPAFIVEQLYHQAFKAGKNAIVESIRTPGEIDMLKSLKNFYLIAVDADPKIRFERIKMRKSETDNINFETFLENEKREMFTDDPNKQNLSKCIAQADFILSNNGTVEDLYKKTDEILQKIYLTK